jgi:uncharacterized protein (TIGR03083 family)
MDPADLIRAIRRDGDAFVDACLAAGLPTPVPSCPGWTVADLLWHLGEVHAFWRTVVADGLTSWEAYERPARPADADLAALVRAGVGTVAEVLAAADPAAANWTWTSDQTAGWVIRRMAHETAIHRCDADEAAGRPVTIEAELASDGIDEFLTWFIGDVAEGAAPVGGSVHLHCTDVAGEWTVRPDGDRFVVTREHAKGDCALRGPAADLLLALWRRRPLATVDVVGDADVAARFVAHPALT